MSTVKPPVAEIYPRTRAAWRRWLGKNHSASAGIWLIYDKGETGREKLSYADAVEEALCVGWIDSTVRGIDDERYKQYFAPRKVKSVWSGSNKERVARLIDQGLMQEPGLTAIDLAQRNGSWEALDSVEAMTIPEELAVALADNPQAGKNFAAFSRSSRKGYLYWVNAAKTAVTRTKRIREVVALAALNEKSRHNP